MMGYVLPPPSRNVVARYQTPEGFEEVELVSRPGAGVPYAGEMPGSPPPWARPTAIPKARYSAAWTPQGPTLTDAELTERTELLYLRRRDELEGAALAGVFGDEGGVKIQVGGLTLLGIAGLAAYLIWRRK